MDISELYIPQLGRSSERGELSQKLPAKSKLVLCDILGAGVIRQLYMTHMNHGEMDSVLASRGVIIRCFWDDEQTPSVEVPLNDFFGVGFGKDNKLDSAAWQRDGHWHLRSLFPMPYKTRAFIEIENLTDNDLYGFYWSVEYDEDVPLPNEIEYFHAQYRQSHPVPKNSIHTVLDVKGHGKYVGTVWSINWLNAGCPPENSFNFFIDEKPIEGKNSEDYFGQSWGFRENFHTFYLGQSLDQEKIDIGSTQMTSYRVHLPNPILFQKSLRFTMDCQGYNGGYRTDTYDTVAFWYQSHPKLQLIALPPLEELLPIQHPNSYWRGLWEIYSSQKKGDTKDALRKANELLKCYPDNAKTPDILYKAATIHEELKERQMASSIYQRIIKEYPKSEAATDALDKIWLLEKSGRMLLTMVSSSGWSAYLDGEEITLPEDIFKEIPTWGERIHYRYGRGQCLRMQTKAIDDSLVDSTVDTPIGIVTDPYQSPVYESEDNIIQWNDSASSVMRLFTLRLEPGSGKHLLAVESSVSANTPIRLESQAPGGMVGILEFDGGCHITDGSWQMMEKMGENWNKPAISDESWKSVTVYPNDSYGDATWFWLHPRGMRKFPGYTHRIWGDNRLCGDRTLRFRKTFTIP